MTDDLRGLSERMARLESGVSQLLESSRQVAALVESIARMQERQERHGGEISALFKRVEDAAKHGHTTDAEVRKWVNRGIGAYTVAGVCCALIVYFASNVIDQVKNNATMLITLDRRIAWVEYELRNGKPAAEVPR